jgi:hypothetical protein
LRAPERLAKGCDLKLEEFRPPKSYIVVGGEIYYLTPFSLGAMVNLGSAYDRRVDIDHSIERFINDLDASLDRLYSLVYFFLEDKDDFPSFCIFKKAIEQENVKGIHAAMIENIVNSQPIREIVENDQSKSTANRSTQQDEPVDWCSLYLRYCAIVPCTIDQFYDLTMRQVFAVFSAHNKRLNPAKKPVFSKTEDEYLSDIAQRELEEWRQKVEKNS